MKSSLRAYTRFSKGAMTWGPFFAEASLSISQLGTALREQGLFD